MVAARSSLGGYIKGQLISTSDLDPTMSTYFQLLLLAYEELENIPYMAVCAWMALAMYDIAGQPNLCGLCQDQTSHEFPVSHSSFQQWSGLTISADRLYAGRSTAKDHSQRLTRLFTRYLAPFRWHLPLLWWTYAHTEAAPV
jgi:hypothetical protein